MPFQARKPKLIWLILMWSGCAKILPFDMHYITTTHLLDRVHPDTLVVNDPFWVRNYPEKLLVLDFPDLTPPHHDCPGA